ncbi:MAG: pilin [Candidatus Campbellbacteria bacterium]|nr:pilin [Candidatus Campbellbacteria bacterium]
MRILTRKNVVFVLTLVVFLVPIFFIHAATEPYTLLVNDIPGLGETVTPGAGGGVGAYLNTIFRIGLGIAVTLAILMFVYNGVIYMTSDIVGNKEGAKKAFLSILGGLVLVFSSVLILEVINPQLVNFGIFETLGAIEPAPGGGGGGGTPPPPGGDGTTDPAMETSARAYLDANHITVNQAACTPGQGAPSCINVGDMSTPVAHQLVALAEACGCNINITGGTERGHTTHGPDKPMYDFSKKIINGQTPPITTYLEGLQKVKVVGGGQVYTDGTSEFWDEPANPGSNWGSHWHACIGTTCRF